MKRYAQAQISRLLGRLVFETRRVAHSADPDAVHDLRVAGRRLAETLRMFEPLLPGSEARKVRRRLRKLRRVSSGVRDRDIALEQFAKAGIKPTAPACRRLAAERTQAEHELAEFLKEWSEHDFSSRWRATLGLRTS